MRQTFTLVEINIGNIAIIDFDMDILASVCDENGAFSKLEEHGVKNAANLTMHPFDILMEWAEGMSRVSDSLLKPLNMPLKDIILNEGHTKQVSDAAVRVAASFKDELKVFIIDSVDDLVAVIGRVSTKCEMRSPCSIILAQNQVV